MHDGFKGIIVTVEDNCVNININDLYQKSHNKKIWWIESGNTKGEHLFTFDKEHVFNLFSDYPYKLTEEQIAIFKEEEPFWADFFRDRGYKKKV